MSHTHVVLLQGHTDRGPWHWQQWLRTQLRERDVCVDFVTCPETAGAGLSALRARLANVPPEAELVVVTHSHGAALWLHHTAHVPESARPADRVLLVAPRIGADCSADERDMTRRALDVSAARRAAGITRLVVGTGDPLLPLHQAHALAASLGVEMDVILEGGHLDTEAGYGPWPAALRWALYGSVPVEDRFAPASGWAERDAREVRRSQL